MLTRRALLGTLALLTLAGTDMNDTAIGIIDRSIRQLDTRIRDLANRDGQSRGRSWWVEVTPDDDDVTDQSAELNAAILLASAGGGTVVIGSGLLLAKDVIWRSSVHIKGAGVNATIVKLPNGANTDVFRSFDFSTLVDTGSSGGITSASITDLTIDGNKTNNLTAGYGIRVYGYDNRLAHLRIHDCRNDGIDSWWAHGGSGLTLPDAMESQVDDVKVHHCGGNGVTWAGPHDSLIDGLITYENAGKGFYLKVTANSTGGASHLSDCHSWGNAQTHAFYLEGQALMTNCQGEGASVCQVLVLANGCQIKGGQYFGVGAATPVGIEIGAVGTAVAGTQVDTYILGCTSGAIKATNDAGLSDLRALVFQTSGAAVTGSLSGSTKRDIYVTGGGTGTTFYLPANDLEVDSTFGIKTFSATGAIDFKTANLVAARVVGVASAANFLTLRPAPTGSAPILYADGADASIDLLLESKGAASSVWLRANGFGVARFIGVASPVNGFQVIAGATGVAPAVKAVGETNVDFGIGISGTGVADFQYGLVALGGGAAATLGTVGGSGPTTPGQNSWHAVKHNGTIGWLAVWR